MNLNLKDIINTKIGRLLVLEFIRLEKVQHNDRLRSRYIYKCLCDCGNISEVNRANLKAKQTLSCGCFQKERSLLGHQKQKGQIRPSLRKPNGESALRSVFLAYKNGAKKRNLNFSIDFSQFSALTKENCVYCGTEPKSVWKNSAGSSQYIANGVDRVNSSIGYELTNCVSCCKICNYMKHELSEKDTQLVNP